MRTTLEEALAAREPRFFRASRGEAKGTTGEHDTARFAENLMVLQECAVLLGEQMEMNAVSYGVFQEGEETGGFIFETDASGQSPHAWGALVNRRMPFRECLQRIHDQAGG
ncbi:MAG: hypothetical protein AAF236_10370 [Verrucomicrobiota bacterium]